MINKIIELNEKIAELTAQKKELEEKLLEELKLPEDFSGSKTFNTENAKITVTARVNKTIDAEKLKEVAREHGVTDALGVIFNWKPSVIKKEWDKVNPEYQAIFSQAITEKIGSKSIKITRKEVK